MKRIFNICKKASEDGGGMAIQQARELASLCRELEQLEGMLSDNADPWVIEHLSTALDDIREVTSFIRSKSHE